ncbi:hypothetical protein ACXYO7_003801 [Salmonella enterica subsp. enterica]
MRYDRYLLINTRPDEAQRNPLHQIVNINLPLNLKLTVGDAFTWLLKQSGYSLCINNHPTQFLAGKPLPLSQYRLGPMRLETGRGAENAGRAGLADAGRCTEPRGLFSPEHAGNGRPSCLSVWLT